MGVSHLLGALGEQQFRRLYLARAFSLFGDGLVPVALAFAVLEIAPTPAGVGFVLASRSVARVVFLLAAGVFADRLPRKHVMIGADLLRLLAQGTIATLLYSAIAQLLEIV